MTTPLLGSASSTYPALLAALAPWPSTTPGPKTIFFWAPAMKWGLVIAGLGDLQRPAEKLSVFQTASLMATGIIWSRYATVITPINYNLMSVNIFVGGIGMYQMWRIWK
ncbi:mitochondrion protein [Polychytrium aggregatum]|uniref:mitochondrion protein n=1 Tax=Polychytrium aggregatum TaxID=110093 RepID=UPI0022FE4D6A|nr:mitochondrion protein [Polychytrium aggregatum]KAI9193414.1 mitochondrion protein [Polychytrium aggregatum]